MGVVVEGELAAFVGIYRPAVLTSWPFGLCHRRQLWTHSASLSYPTRPAAMVLLSYWETGRNQASHLSAESGHFLHQCSQAASCA